MKILFVNYMNRSLATMVRSFELARATSRLGHVVTLAFMHPGFQPPISFMKVLANASSESFKIRHRSSQLHIGYGYKHGEAGKVTECKPSASGLFKQMMMSFQYIRDEFPLVREEKPDVIVARPDHVLSFLVTSGAKEIPLVLETDGPIEELDYYWGISSRWFRPIDTFRARRADAILYISGTCGRLWSEKRLPPERLFLCPNGADPDVFRPFPVSERNALRSRFGLEGSTVVGFTGNQRKWHGVGEFLRALVGFLEKNPRLMGLVIGEIEDRNALMLDRIPEDLLRKRFVFTGPVSYMDMPAYIDLADVLVMPFPRLELFHASPMKMFEGLSMNKILVASAQGQIRDILSGLPTTFLYDPDDPVGIVGALQEGIRMAESGAKSNAGRDLLIREHTWHHRGRVVETACRYAVITSKRYLSSVRRNYSNSDSNANKVKDMQLRD